MSRRLAYRVRIFIAWIASSLPSSRLENDDLQQVPGSIWPEVEHAPRRISLVTDRRRVQVMRDGVGHVNGADAVLAR